MIKLRIKDKEVMNNDNKEILFDIKCNYCIKCEDRIKVNNVDRVNGLCKICGGKLIGNPKFWKIKDATGWTTEKKGIDAIKNETGHGFGKDSFDD